MGPSSAGGGWMVLSDGRGLTAQLGCRPEPGPGPWGQPCLPAMLRGTSGWVAGVGGSDELGPRDCPEPLGSQLTEGDTQLSRVGVQGTWPDLASEPFPRASQPPKHIGCCVQRAPTRALKQEAAQRFQLEGRLEREGVVAPAVGARTGEGVDRAVRGGL